MIKAIRFEAKHFWAIVCLSVILGFTFSQLYNAFIPSESPEITNQCDTQAKIAGLWLPNIQALSNYSGRYICVNIDATTTLTELERVCKHEIGHEIYARYCESEENWEKCLGAEK